MASSASSQVGQDFPGGRVEVGGRLVVPDGQLVAVEPDDGGIGPPHLVVGRGQDPAQVGAGDGAAHGQVDVRGEPPLRLDGGEVLQVVAEEAAQVLDEPVEQRREVQRVPCRPLVVVGGRVGRGAVLTDPAVAGAGERDEQRRPEPFPVRGGVGLADRPGRDLPARQRRGVLPSPGGAVPPHRPGREHVAAHPCLGDLLVEFGGQLVQVAGVLPVVVGLVAHGLGLGALFDPPLLVFGRLVRLDDRFGLEVPAFPALRGPQRLGPFRARRAHGGEGVPARDEDLLHGPGAEVGAAQLHRADAGAVLDGQVLDDLAGQRHGQPFGPRGLPRAGLGHQSPPSRSVSARGRV